jgi:inositol-phosphate transport system substrate-binding protein
MRLRQTPVRILILLGLVFALVAGACGDSSDDAAPATTAGAPQATQAADAGIELVSLTARCKANPPTEDGRCNNLLRAIPAANAALEAAGDNRRIDLTIIQDNADWGDYKNEFVLASDAGEAPDIIVSGHEDIGAWATSGIILDVTDKLGNYSEFDDVIESLWTSTELNGRRWGVPQDAEARPMYYRTDLLAELGWSQAEIDGLPAAVESGAFTWEDMIDTAAEAVDAGVVDAGKGWWHRPKNGPDFLYYYYAAGGELTEAGSDALLFDKAAALKSFEVVADAVERDVLVSTRLDGDWSNWNTDVALGKVLFWFGGSWQWADWAQNFVADLGGEDYLFDNVGFSAIPGLAAGTGQPITLTHPLVYMVSTGADAELALTLIAKATTKELNTTYAVASGHLGILKSQETYAPYTDARLLSEVLPLLEFTTFLPNSEFWSPWSEAYFVGLSAVESGDLSPAGAVDVVVDLLENELGENVKITG